MIKYNSKANKRHRRSKVTYRYLAQVEIFSKNANESIGEATLTLFSETKLITADNIQKTINRNIDELTNIDLDQTYVKMHQWLAL